MMETPFLRPLWLLPLAVLAGCGGSGLNTAPVTGTVTLDGQPLPNATVQFIPETSDLEAPVSQGVTDEQGRYSLNVVATGDSGAVVGKHRVTIHVYAQQADPEDDADLAIAEEQIVPPQYNEESELTYEVKSGSNVADWNL